MFSYPQVFITNHATLSKLSTEQIEAILKRGEETIKILNECSMLLHCKTSDIQRKIEILIKHNTEKSEEIKKIKETLDGRTDY